MVEKINLKNYKIKAMLFNFSKCIDNKIFILFFYDDLILRTDIYLNYEI